MFKPKPPIVPAQLFLIAALVALIAAQPVAAAGFPDASEPYLNDFAGVVEPGDAEAIRGALKRLREETGIEATVVTIRSMQEYGTGESNTEGFATGLFNAWGIGKQSTDNGALLLVAVNDRKLRIEVGDGYGSSLEAPAKRIIDNTITPKLRAGQMSAGIRVGSEALCETLRGTVTAEAPMPAPLTAETPPITAEAPETAQQSMTAPVIETPSPVQAVQAPKTIPIERAREIERAFLRNQSQRRTPSMSTPTWSLLSIVTGLTAGAAACLGAVYVFFRPVRCEKCRKSMQLCDPIHDFDHLNAGQQLEEKLQSVDYQFYRCAGCGHEIMRTKRRLFSGYANCTRCRFRTVQETQQIIAQATRHSTGSKLITRRCLACGYRDEQTVMLARLPDDDNNFSHHGTIGSHSIGSSFGGSSSGGGSHFGGGHSSGGGASGGW